MKLKKKLLDLAGILGAALCAIHCTVLPFLTFIPLGSGHDHYIDLFLALLGFGIVYKISRKEQPKSILLMLWVSIGIVLAGTVISILTSYHIEFTKIGSFGLIIGHLINLKHMHYKNKLKHSEV
ncbi:MerC domain-containing protein [Autumnicola musiva]|uniref:MerC domain-containing protein n=1 Tax=Autumnicola musiva TaxID=3075589 RepID=A0ABU3DBG4_9FLAO|nr:MerC domain-containing protein [Zunongwangia sp. F117]MDT0678709.1 MerC domain-containing protein [Zunongwangia sp. F117]